MTSQSETIFHLPDFFVTELIDDLQSQTVDWGVRFVGADKAWTTTRGRGIVVAVLDTGCDAAHPDLKGQIVAQRDFTNSGTDDRNGHGTHCAGVIAAADNSVGVIGVAPESKLLIGKVLGNDGSGASSWIAAGIRWATNNKAHVISMSLGSSRPDAGTHAAIKEAVQAGVIVVAAAGNSGPGTINYPGAYPEVISVGAIDATGRIANFSSQNREVDVAAPGVNILSSVPGGRWARMSGTSMATPLVAGVVALIQSARLSAGRELLTAEEVLKLLKSSSVDAGTAGRDPAYGWGIVDPRLLLSGDFPLPPPVRSS